MSLISARCISLAIIISAVGCRQAAQGTGKPVVVSPRRVDTVCIGTGGPSVAVEVRDPLGRPAALGTTIVIQDGAFKDSVDGTRHYSPLLVGAGERRPGVYEVRLDKPGYKPVLLHEVRAPGDPRCKYAEPTDIRRVTLELRPDAPAIRGVVVMPPGIVHNGSPGREITVFAMVDGADGVSRAVTWSSSDTTLLRLVPTSDTTALLCPLNRRGNVQVTATSRENPSARGVANIGLWIQENSDRGGGEIAPTPLGPSRCA